MLCWVCCESSMLGFSKKGQFSQVMGVYSVMWVLSFGFAILQTHKAHFSSSPHLAQLFCLHCTLVWLFCRKTYLHQTPSWLWLVWTNSPVFSPPGYRLVSTNNTQTLLYAKYCHVHEHPDSTISKVLIVLKWQIITTLNCWKNRG